MRTEKLAAQVIGRLKEQNMTLATAESCTGGLVGKYLTDVPGASAAYVGGVVSYTNEVKMQLLGVQSETLAVNGAVSSQTAEEMAKGVRQATGATYGVAVTGLAGPTDDGSGWPVGMVFVACSDGEKSRMWAMHIAGDRSTVREKAAEAALELVYKMSFQGKRVPVYARYRDKNTGELTKKRFFNSVF